MPLFLSYFLSSFYHFLSFTPFLFFTFSFLLSCCGLFLIWSFLFQGPFLQVLTTLLLWVFPLRCLCPLGSPSFDVFPLHFSPLFLLWLPSFYSKLIRWDFSPLPLGLHQMLFVVGILSRLPTHPLVAPAIAQYMFTALLLISRQNSLFFVSTVCLYLTTQLYGMHQMVLTIYYFFWVRYHPNKIYSLKKSQQETKYKPPFPSTTKPRPLNPLDHGPTSLVLAGYRLVVLQPFCACSIVFCVCLPCRFCHSRSVLFRSTVCLYLISSCVSRCICLFLQFGFSSLHAFLATNTSCCSLFPFTVLFHISFYAYLLYKRIWAFMGQIMLTRSKGSWAQFVFICQNHSAKDLYSAADLYYAANPFPLHFFLWTSLALWSSWQAFGPCFSLGIPLYGFLDTDSQKWASTFHPLSIWIAPAIHMRKLMQFSFIGCFTTHMRMLLFFSSRAYCFNFYFPQANHFLSFCKFMTL